MALGVIYYAKVFWIGTFHQLDDESALRHRLFVSAMIVVVVPTTLMAAGVIAGANYVCCAFRLSQLPRHYLAALRVAVALLLNHTLTTRFIVP